MQDFATCSVVTIIFLAEPAFSHLRDTFHGRLVMRLLALRLLSGISCKCAGFTLNWNFFLDLRHWQFATSRTICLGSYHIPQSGNGSEWCLCFELRASCSGCLLEPSLEPASSPEPHLTSTSKCKFYLTRVCKNLWFEKQRWCLHPTLHPTTGSEACPCLSRTNLLLRSLIEQTYCSEVW